MSKTVEVRHRKLLSKLGVLAKAMPYLCMRIIPCIVISIVLVLAYLNHVVGPISRCLCGCGHDRLGLPAKGQAFWVF